MQDATNRTLLQAMTTEHKDKKPITTGYDQVAA